MPTTRRSVLRVGAALSALPHSFAVHPWRGPAPLAIQSGDPAKDSAILWARAETDGQMIVEWDTRPDFKNARRVPGPPALAEWDHTATMPIVELPAAERIHYRVAFRPLDGNGVLGPWKEGALRTASRADRDVRVLWSGDVAGQGWGIDPARGGMGTFTSMAARDADLFVHCGDTIYADNPIEATRALPGGGQWNNLVIPEVQKVAETLGEFRARYRYNHLDEPLRRFAARVPTLALWDDHETTNNWYPGETLDDPRYANVRSVDLLAARARRAFFENHPIRPHPEAAGRIYRKVAVAPSVDVFALDLRTYRGANSANDQTEPGPATACLGGDQLAWLIAGLRSSKATWKIIASDMPIGLMVGDGAHAEAVANGDHGAPSGRELEWQRLLRAIERAGVQNTLWVTADVHYAAAHHYHPDRASWRGFTPFWEFVAGPLHAGAFGPGKLDRTFGPEVVFQRVPPRQAMGPAEGFQSFGEIEIEAGSHALTVTLRDGGSGDALFAQRLEPVR